jgi:epoxyqueuosine reductase
MNIPASTIEPTASGLRALVYDAARQVGFDLCGIAPVDLPGEHVQRWGQWLAAGRHGNMGWMTRPEHGDLRKLVPWVKSVICLGLNYWHPEEQRGVPSGLISVYAQGQDYHDVMKRKMGRLLDALFQQLPAGFEAGFEAKIYIDTGPILERAYATAAGLGWIGKNTCLINEQRGSWFFLGEILTSLELPPESPPPDRCGTCTACLDACPTGAFVAPYQLDARKCISYQTIELRGTIPEADRPGLGTHIFGCDICQDVCPWNGRSRPTTVAEFLPLEVLTRNSGATLEQLAQLSHTEFKQDFRSSAIKRTKHQGLLRNAAVALGNAGDASALPALEHLAAADDPVISEHARWAIAQLQHPEPNRAPTEARGPERFRNRH